MRMGFDVVSDMPILSKRLVKLAEAAKDDVLRKALEQGSERVVRAIQIRISTGARRSRGNLEKGITYRINSSYLTGRAQSATFGWKKLRVRTSRKGVATYVTDYGPVLEYDKKRRLRHLESGFEEARQSAETAMLAVIRRAMKKTT